MKVLGSHIWNQSPETVTGESSNHLYESLNGWFKPNKWQIIVFDSLYFAFSYTVYIFLVFQLLAKMLNFIFTKTAWRSGFHLTWLTVAQEK